jgi:hypothetical protein
MHGSRSAADPEFAQCGHRQPLRSILPTSARLRWLTRGPRDRGIDLSGNSVDGAMPSIYTACPSPARFAPSVLPAPKNSFREPLQAHRPIQATPEKYFCFVLSEIMLVCPRPASQEGRFAVVTDVECGMRWACRCCSVVDPCRRTALMRTVKSRGPDTPTLVSRLRRRSRVAQATVAKKPGAPGRTRSSRSNHPRGECRDVSAEPVVPAACIFFAGGPWVRPAPGIPRALCLKRAGLAA